MRLEDFDTTTMEQGLCLSIFAFVYCIGTLLTPFLPKWISKRFTLIVSSFLMGVCLLFVGPSSILGINESFTLLIVSLFLTAMFLAPTVIPVLPEMLSSIEGKIDKSEEQMAGDYTGALLSTFLALG